MSKMGTEIVNQQETPGLGCPVCGVATLPRGSTCTICAGEAAYAKYKHTEVLGHKLYSYGFTFLEQRDDGAILYHLGKEVCRFSTRATTEAIHDKCWDYLYKQISLVPAGGPCPLAVRRIVPCCLPDKKPCLLRTTKGGGCSVWEEICAEWKASQ